MWNGTNDQRQRVSAGIYFCRLTARTINCNTVPSTAELRSSDFMGRLLFLLLRIIETKIEVGVAEGNPVNGDGAYICLVIETMLAQHRL